MKKILKLSLITGLLLGSNLFAKELSYYLKYVNNDNTTVKEDKKVENYISKKYNLNIKKYTIKERIDQINDKTFNLGIIYRKNYTNKEWLGINLEGKITFPEIGYPLKNVYADVNVFNDAIDIDIRKRFFNYIISGNKKLFVTKTGFYLDAGIGIRSYINDGLEKQGTSTFYLEGTTGFRTKEWIFKISGNYSFLGHKNIYLTIGKRW